MDANSIQQRIEAAIETIEVRVQLDGNKCHVLVVSDQFDGLRAVKKQQMVYSCLTDLLSSGELHAVSMQTLTTAEWQEQKKFN